MGLAVFTLFTFPIVVNVFGLYNAIDCVRRGCFAPTFAFAVGPSLESRKYLGVLGELLYDCRVCRHYERVMRIPGNKNVPYIPMHEREDEV